MFYRGNRGIQYFAVFLVFCTFFMTCLRQVTCISRHIISFYSLLIYPIRNERKLK